MAHGERRKSRTTSSRDPGFLYDHIVLWHSSTFRQRFAGSIEFRGHAQSMQPLFFLWPLTGGLLIGLAAGLYFLLAGRIAGISTITAKVAGLAGGAPRLEPIVFLGGLIGGAAATAHFIRKPEIIYTAEPWQVVLAGLLVGFGTRLGSGCTSGHGVCGMARLSPRSIVATLVFMVTAIVTVYVNRHLLGGFFG